MYGFGADDLVSVTAQACDGAACGDVVGPVEVMAGAMDGVQECVEGAGGDPCDGTVAGDANLDEEINVLDIVQIVNHILESALLTDECAILAADFTADGDVNVLDIVQIVNIILEGRITGDASSATLKNVDGQMTMNADGYIGGVQMTVSHNSDFLIKMTDLSYLSDYVTKDNQTTLMIIKPVKELFSYEGEFEIVDLMVVNSQNEIAVNVIASSFTISDAYPNPFNPTTSVNLTVPFSTNVDVNVYNVAGQIVSSLASGYMDADTYHLTWDADGMTSGVYFIQATLNGTTSSQKVMLIK